MMERLKAYLRAQNRLTREFTRSKLSAFLRISGAAFAALMVLGFILGFFMQDLTDGFVDFFAQTVEQNGILDSDGQIRFLPLLVSNLRASAITVLYGFIPYIFMPAFSLGLNALLLGFFAAFYCSNGMSMLYYFMALLPHGIFELPALVISIAAGLYLCRTINLYIRHNTKGLVKAAVADITRVYLLRALPLFLLAAVAETYLTPWILSFI